MLKALKNFWEKITYPFIAFSILRDEERRVSYDERKERRK
jgi:hypothetical protein